MACPIIRIWSRRVGIIVLLATASGLAQTPAFGAGGFGRPVVSGYSLEVADAEAIGERAVQDSQGIVYFAASGLLSFDGERWTSYPAPGSYFIRHIEFGPDGRLWAATTNDLGWFERTRNQGWAFRSLRDRLPPEHASIGEVWAAYPDDQGVTFVASDRILRWDGSQFAITHLPGPRRLFPSRSGKDVFVHHLPDGVYRVDESGLQLFLPRSILGGKTVMWIDRRGGEWMIGAAEGLFVYDRDGLRPFSPDSAGFFETNRLTCAAWLPDGRIGAGTLEGGLVVIRPDGSVDSFIGKEDGLGSRYVTSLFVGRDRELWVTTYAKIVRFELLAPTGVFDGRLGVPKQAIREIAGWRDHLVISTDTDAFLLRPGAEQFTSIAGMKGASFNLHRDESGIMIAGFRGVKHWDGSQISEFYPSTFDALFAQRSASNPNEFLISENRTIVGFNPGQYQRIIVRDLPEIATLAGQDSSGRLWLGTFGNGLLIADPIEGSSVTAMPASGSFGLPNLQGYVRVRATDDGAIVVVADNGAWMKPAGAGRFTAVRNYPARAAAAVSEATADQRAVWVIHAAGANIAPGVGRIAFNRFGAEWQSHSVTGLDAVGAPRSIFADTRESGETVLWIGGTQALLRHMAGPMLSAPAPRPPLLQAFAVAGNDAAPAPITAALPYATQAIEFRFAAPEYSRRAQLRIESRIDGIDQNWIPAAHGSRRELTAIRDGRYTVRARVLAETGAISDEATVAFEVLPPWWRTAPALLGAALALAPLVYGFFRLRIRALRRRNAELEEKVRVRTRELEAANATKTQFVANISHDIRNPLNGIVGLALALEDTKLDTRQREIVSTLQECTTYLSSLVDDVLDFASIEAGKVELRTGAFPPAGLLNSIVTTVRSETAERGATILVEADPDLPSHLMGDAGRIQQILVNYVSNALKYAGGHIRLSAAIPAGAPEEIEFAVTDEGPGISEADQATLFRKFTRLSGAHRDGIPGSGLGLASCRLLADIMGGSVGVTSTPGQGARFHLRLPLVPAAEPAELPAARLPNTTVLLVEDTDYNAWATTAVLRRLGLGCERASTGAEALRRFGEKRYNVVLLDRNLPDMDGTQVARRMREMEDGGSHAVLLAVTAYCTSEDRACCLEAGMDAFVGKPLTPDKLRKVFRDLGRRMLAGATMQAHDIPAQGRPADTGSGALDMSMLRYLADESPQGLAYQIERFIAALDETETAVSGMMRLRDFASLAPAAHGLLGQARMVGADTLAAAAAGLEAAARSADPSGCADRVREVRRAIRLLKAALRHHRSAERTA